MNGGPLGVFIAFVAGLLSCLSPCVLPLVPIYVFHLGTTGDGSSGRRKLLQHSIAFVAGFTLVFVALGLSLGLVGSALQAHLVALQRLSGVLMIAMGFYLLGLIPIPWLSQERVLRLAPAGAGYLRSFSVGTMLSLGWTPCIGPTLGAILALAAVSRTAVEGGYLLFAFSMGLAVPFILTALALTPVQDLLRRFRSAGRAVELVGGVVLIVTGVLIFDGLLTQLNNYFQVNGLVPKL